MAREYEEKYRLPNGCESFSQLLDGKYSTVAEVETQLNFYYELEQKSMLGQLVGLGPERNYSFRLRYVVEQCEAIWIAKSTPIGGDAINGRDRLEFEQPIGGVSFSRAHHFMHNWLKLKLQSRWARIRSSFQPINFEGTLIHATEDINSGYGKIIELELIDGQQENISWLALSLGLVPIGDSEIKAMYEFVVDNNNTVFDKFIEEQNLSYAIM